MDKSLSPWHNLPRIIAFFILGSLLFAVAYSQSPLYTSNQNQYFLHGLAKAGFGNLRQDWLANTQDPTPVFSALVEITYQYIHIESVFYIYYALLMGIYLFSMYGITDYLFDLRSSRTKTLLFLAIFITIHSAGLRFGFSRLLGTNWTYILEDGVADQRLLGPVFQPSTLGVLIILSIYLFVKSRPYLAIITAVLAAIVHPTYLLSAAVLTISYMVAIYIDTRQIRIPLFLGVIALIAVAPIAVYVALNFNSPSPDLAEKARRILVEYRIPHHAIVNQWLDATVLVKLTFVTIALFLVRGTRLFIILLIATLSSILLTLIQVVTNSYYLALLFPWRLSTFIVPISVTIILGYLLTRLLDIRRMQSSRWKTIFQIVSIVIIFLSVLVGSIRFLIDLERKASEPERAVEAYIYTQHRPDDIYLIPTKMQDFRLNSGAPAYVEFKSIPYKDADVLEWYHRVSVADRFYKNLDCNILAKLVVNDHITDAILETDMPALKCAFNDEIYRDKSFIIYRLSAP